MIYPCLDMQSRRQLQRLDSAMHNLCTCSRCQQRRQAAESPSNDHHARGPFSAPLLGFQPNLLPVQGPFATQPHPAIQQVNNVEPAQASPVNAAPALQTNMAPRGFWNDPIQDQHLGLSAGNSPSRTLLPQKASSTSLTPVPELSEDGESAASEPLLTPRTLGSLNALPASPVDSQLSVIIERVEIPFIEGPISTILGANSNYAWNFDSSGLIHNPITGTYEKRKMVDDFPGLTRKRHKRQWDNYMKMDRETRPYIELYQDGDSELELSEWEVEKEIRKRNRTISQRQERQFRLSQEDTFVSASSLLEEAAEREEISW